ncbi:MAG: hypothetical protein IJ366_05455 [Clostridia bacterium]|nr:hypothetical protein [Clostridia bacterium]
MKKIAYLCILSIIISLFGNYTVLAQSSAEYDAKMLEVLGITDGEIADGYVTRGQFAVYIAQIANGGKKVTEAEAIKLMLEEGWINNAASGEFEADMAIRNDVAAKALVDLLGYSFKVDSADDYWTVAGELKINGGMSKTALLTAENCGKMLENALDAYALEFLGASGESVEFTRVKAIKFFFDLRVIEGDVDAVGGTSVTGAGGVGTGRVKISGNVFDCEYDMANLLGLSVTAYIRNSDNTVIYAKDDSRNLVVITDDKLDRDETTKNEIAVKDSNRTYKLEGEVDVILNNDGVFGYTLADLLPDYGSLTLIDNDGNGRFDVVRVMSYQAVAVNFIDATTKSIGDFYGNNIKDLAELDEVTVTKNGKPIYFSEILQDDVVGVAFDRSGERAEIVVSSDKINGMVESMDESEGEIVIDGVTYDIAPFFLKLKDGVKPVIKLGDNVTVTLDIYGRAAYIKKSTSGTLRYGYMLRAYDLDNGEKGVKIFADDGMMYTYGVNERAKLDKGLEYSKENIMKMFENDGFNVTPQLVKYRINADNEIMRLYSSNSDQLSCDFAFAQRAESGNRILSSGGGDFIYDNSTVIFSVPHPTLTDVTDEDYRVTKKAINTSYTYTQIAGYDVDEFGIAKAMVSRSTASQDAKFNDNDRRDTAILVVSKVITMVNADGDEVMVLRGFDKDEEKEYYFKPEKFSLLANVEKGDAVLCLKDYVTEYVVDLEILNKASEKKYGVVTKKVSSGIPYYETIRGRVYNRLGSTLKISDKLSPKTTTDYKLYPATGAAVIIVEGGNPRYGNIGEVCIGDEIFLRTRASVVWEIIIYR